MAKKKRKKHFLEGFYTGGTINPDDVIYKKGAERPSDEKIIKEAESQEFAHNRVPIFMTGTLIVIAVSKVIFGAKLSFSMLLGLGCVAGTLFFFIR